MSYPLALALTLVVEIPTVMAIGGRRAGPTAVAANLTSHPLLWLAMLEFGVGLAVGEIAVFAFEWWALVTVAGIRPWRAALAAGLANALSLGLGLAVFG